MLYENIGFIAMQREAFVLILILMEYALWAETSSGIREWERVLILILMEYALWVLNT